MSKNRDSYRHVAILHHFIPENDDSPVVVEGLEVAYGNSTLEKIILVVSWGPWVNFHTKHLTKLVGFMVLQ